MKKASLVFLVLLFPFVITKAQTTHEEGKKLFETQKYDAAKKVFTQILKANEADSEANYFMGLIYFVSEKDYDEAEEYLEKAVEYSPKNAQYHYMLGATYGEHAARASIFSQLSLAGSCKDEFETAVKLDPSHVEARIGLIQYLLQAPGIAGGSVEDAKVQIEELKKYNLPAHYIFKASIAQRDEKFKEAEKYYLEGIKADPQNPRPYNALGYLYMNSLNEPDKALEQFKKLVEHGSQFANSFDSLGDGYANKKMYKEALENYLKAVKLDPKFSVSVYNVGKMYEKLGQKNDAIKWYKKYLALDEDGKYASEAEDRLDELQ